MNVGVLSQRHTASSLDHRASACRTCSGQNMISYREFQEFMRLSSLIFSLALESESLTLSPPWRPSSTKKAHEAFLVLRDVDKSPKCPQRRLHSIHRARMSERGLILSLSRGFGRGGPRRVCRAG